jgi:hypothetical protein
MIGCGQEEVNIAMGKIIHLDGARLAFLDDGLRQSPPRPSLSFRRITQDVRPPMPDYQDFLAHIRRIDIPAADLARWEAAAERLQPVTPAVLLEVSDLHADPCKHRLGRAANAARYAASIADEPLKTEAVALAEEFRQKGQAAAAIWRDRNSQTPLRASASLAAP